jgi:hypothetical protein
VDYALPILQILLAILVSFPMNLAIHSKKNRLQIKSPTGGGARVSSKDLYKNQGGSVA